MLAAMTRLLFLGLGLGLVVAGCGGSDAKPVDAATGQDGTAPGGSMTLTSPAFSEGGIVPTVNTCNGANTSPTLTWTGAPSGTQSFAVVLTDLTISMAHWVIYDIPASATALPAGIENTADPASVSGAHQIVSIHAPVVGYYGPCPPNPPAHSYQFAVYALDVTPLPGVTAQSTRPETVAAVQAHRLAGATLTGSYVTP
jgi:Raf kinase inhibitor-like YbhB/YbcL family protein